MYVAGLRMEMKLKGSSSWIRYSKVGEEPRAVGMISR